MWSYQKKLQYPVNIKNANPKLAQFVVAQYGGPNGELAASLRYLSQRFSMPNEMTKALLTDIGVSVTTLPFFQYKSSDSTNLLTTNVKNDILRL